MEYLQSKARQTDLLFLLPVMEIRCSLHNMILKNNEVVFPHQEKLCLEIKPLDVKLFKYYEGLHSSQLLYGAFLFHIFQVCTAGLLIVCVQV